MPHSTRINILTVSSKLVTQAPSCGIIAAYAQEICHHNVVDMIGTHNTTVISKETSPTPTKWGIQASTAPSSHPAHADLGVWAIIREFATSEVPPPLVETRLQQHLSSRYVASSWEAALKAVMDAEGNTAQACAAVEELASVACQRSGLVLKLTIPKPPQFQVLERDLTDSIMILKDKNRIFGAPLSVDELLDPLQEREDLDMEAEMFENDSEIIAGFRRREAVRNGDIIEVDSDDEDDQCHGAVMATSELIALAERLEAGCVADRC